MCRCPWALNSELERHYHDTEWGVPQYAADRLFEFLLLEGLQAGLSWRTVLQKREAYRQVTHGFDPHWLAQANAEDVAGWMQDSRLIRNRQKCQALIRNAQAWLRLQQQGVDPVAWLWRCVDGRPIASAHRHFSSVPAETKRSRWLSKELKSAGFVFVGPVISYAFMQATGMVNDHLIDCFRHAELACR